jgi:hypothetical protein
VVINASVRKQVKGVGVAKLLPEGNCSSYRTTDERPYLIFNNKLEVSIFL